MLGVSNSGYDWQRPCQRGDGRSPVHDCVRCGAARMWMHVASCVASALCIGLQRNLFVRSFQLGWAPEYALGRAYSGAQEG